jgi:hypothetical protein
MDYLVIHTESSRDNDQAQKNKEGITCGRDKGAAISVNIFPHIIILGKVEEFANLGGPLGSPHSWHLLISQAWKRIVTWHKAHTKQCKILESLKNPGRDTITFVLQF